MIDLATPLLLASLSAGADVGTTQWAKSRGAIESNPTLQSDGALYARAAAGVILYTVADVTLQKRAPKWVWVPRVLVLGAGIGIGIHNYQVGRRQLP